MDLQRMLPAHQVIMLKFIKNLSMLSSTLEQLQNSNAIEVLTRILERSRNQPHFKVCFAPSIWKYLILN